MPMVLDLADGRALWTDVHLPGDRGFHSAGRHHDGPARMGRDPWDHFTGGARVFLGGPASPARGGARRRGGRRPAGPAPWAEDELWVYRRRQGEEVPAFAAGLRALGTQEERPSAGDARTPAAGVAGGRHTFFAVVDGDVRPEKATGAAYRLFPGPLDGCAAVARVTAGELLADPG
ncbi:hypothetical protein ABZ951_17710 [Streptomyces sp. NPDC046215]|uniref:Uncharacterized protein n=1 Tax=Streptomyces stramineus TaxID=173861 RepID=A0ABN1BFS7_9ACTN